MKRVVVAGVAHEVTKQAHLAAALVRRCRRASPAAKCALLLLVSTAIPAHAAEPSSAPAKASAAKPAAAADAAPAEWPPDNAPMYRLAGRAGLPNYLKATSAVAGPQGLAAEEIRTTDTGLINKDFTFDVVFRFKNDDEQAIVMMGLGALGKDVGPTVYSRIHGPGHGGACTLSIAGKPETELGKLTHKAVLTCSAWRSGAARCRWRSRRTTTESSIPRR